MNRVLPSLLLLLLFNVAILRAGETQLLLEVRVSSNEPMVISSPEEYLHLRVSADGLVEYEDRNVGESKFMLRQTRLSSPELRLLEEFLDSSAVQMLEPEYPPASQTIDRRTLIKISINRGGRPQTIMLPNFNLPLGKDKACTPRRLLISCVVSKRREEIHRFALLQTDGVLFGRNS